MSEAERLHLMAPERLYCDDCGKRASQCVCVGCGDCGYLKEKCICESEADR